ncbi:hypothetical protein WR25_10756 [Diploscapter pachys]|uniref:Uncharacterized protein n=1 Tax=Diploscapter pachys TaxID=2018661 RepID=A0A2A2JBB6_9BILA|nr:hypothetical protein WR25_10756 [Diploscapter pachys]
MKFLLVSILLIALVYSAFGCMKFDKHVQMFCKYGGEQNVCLHNNANNFKSTCCAMPGGCSSLEFPKNKVCCFTQECLNRCYPGKRYQIGSVY